MKPSEVDVDAAVMIIGFAAQRACEVMGGASAVGTIAPEHGFFGGATGQSPENDPNKPHTHVAQQMILRINRSGLWSNQGTVLT